ncbi:site-specific integrase [Marinobacter sp. BW6]|uniref:integrase domain-containing protein n=1 Tax=Marinobacter sp. BW6 TaxID=2592624 RepID=UPI0011DEA11E|nr:integrase domain-containing protein [Marinobacter sp. BW6]TYC63830.1 site-specific integrase [Marinobacter sp. BW6]
MKRKKKIPCSKNRNYGFGKTLLFAFKNAIDALFGRFDHYGTRRSHMIRIRVFAEFCRRHGIRDARDIDAELVASFGEYLKQRLKEVYEWPDGTNDKQISAAYAHNLISTMNTCLFAMRRDEVLHLSARKALGVARSNVRRTQIAADVADTKSATDRMVATGLQRGAAVVLLARAWGMRVYEAMLQDLDRMQSEVKKNGAAAILEGTKGGRKCLTRTIQAGDFQMEALDLALSVRPTGSRCLLMETEKPISFYRTELNQCRRILQKYGIPSFRELRSGFAEDIYEAIVQGPSPLRGSIKDRELDRIARKEIARLLGHARFQIASSYIGGY